MECNTRIKSEEVVTCRVLNKQGKKNTNDGLRELLVVDVRIVAHLIPCLSADSLAEQMSSYILRTDLFLCRGLAFTYPT